MRQRFQHPRHPDSSGCFSGVESEFRSSPVFKQPFVLPKGNIRSLKPKVQKAIHVARTYGIRRLLKRSTEVLYRDLIRPCLPSVGFARYAGIPVGYARKWGDESIASSFLPEHALDAPEYEAALVAGLKAHVREGDHVVVVGGGVGVTVVTAAMESGPSGSVICFEAASESAEMVRRTASLNGVSDRMTVIHAVVARSVCSYGTLPDDDFVLPQDLPKCDVLELDCEGAELDILRSMVIRPRVILVETHGSYGSPTSEVTSMLLSYGYSVSDLGVAEPRMHAFCEEDDIRVVIGALEKRQLSA